MKQWLYEKKSRVIISGLIITAIPIIGLALFVYFETANYIKNDVIKEDRQSAIIVTERIKKALGDEVRLGNLLASRPRLKAGIKLTDRKEITSHLKAFIDNSVTIERAYITNSRGIMLADYPSDPSVLNMDTSQQDWYKGVSKKWIPYVSEFYLRVAKPQRYLFTIAIPVNADDKSIIGILVLQPEAHYLKNTLAHVPVQQNQITYLVDKNGNLIYHSKYVIDRAINISGFPVVQNVRKGQTGVETYFNQDGLRILTAYRNIEEYGWGVVVERPEKEAFAPIREITFGLFAFASIMLLTGVYFAYSRSVLIYSLRKLSEELETRVDNRTYELKVANTQLSVEIQERKEAAELLQKSEKKLKDITSFLAEGIYVSNEQGNIIFMNPEAERLLGWTVMELMNKTAHNIIHSRNADGTLLPFEECEMHNVIKTEIPFVSRDEVFIRKSGTVFPISVVTSPIMENGKVVGAVTAFRDITERKNVEEALKESENKYRTLVENIPEKIFLKDRNSVFISCNDNLARDLKIDPSKITGLTDYDLCPKEMAEKYRADDKRVMETGKKEEIEEKYLLDGNEYFVHTIKTPVRNSKGNVTGILGVFRDITERKRTEEHSRKAKELSDALNSIDAVIHSTLNIDTIMQRVIEEAGKVIDVDAASIGLFQDDYFVMKYIYNMPKDLAELRISLKEIKGVHFAASIKDVVTFNDAFSDERLNPELIRKYGIRAMMVAPFVVSGKVLGAMSFYCFASPYSFSDMHIDFVRKLSASLSLAIKNADLFTELKHTGEALRRSEKGLTKAEEIAHLGSWELDLMNKRLSWSDEVYRIFGLKPQEFGATYEAFLERVHPDDRASVDAAYSGSIREGRDTYEIEHRIVRKSTEEVRIVHEKCEHFRDEAGRIIRSLGMVHDITERKLVEKKLEAANKELEAFSYSVSHDLRAPLRHASGFVKLLEKRLKDNPDELTQHYTAMIDEASKRMERLIDDLLSFSRVGRSEMQKRKVGFNALVREVAREIKEETKGRDIVWEVDELPYVYGDKSLLRLVLVNLLSNAVKFTSTHPRAEIRIGFKEEGDELIFFVKDNGVGFDMQYAGRLFGVFQRLHTQKEFEGTGIGLANVRRIISRHGGRIWAEGSVGQGAVFYFTLPKTKEIKST